MSAPRSQPVPAPDDERCEQCGAAALYWLRCKLVCASCRAINKSCADL